MKLVLAAPAGFVLRSTVLSHGYYQTLPFAWDDAAGVLHRVDRLRPGGRAHQVEVRQDGARVIVEVRGARAIPEAYAERVTRMLQLRRELSPFYQAIAAEAHLGWIARGGYGRVLRTGDLFEDVVKAICGTNIQWPQAVKIINRITSLGPRVAGRAAFPTPEEIAEAGASWLREEARTGYRAEAIVELASRVASGELDLEAWEREAAAMSGEAVRKRIATLRGIGPATAAYLAAFLGKHDRASVDSAVIAYASRAHFGGARPAPAEVAAHFERYGPWAGLVSWFEVWGDWCQRTGVPL